MASFHFDLVSPERVLFTGEVDQVDVPGTEGDFGVLAEHAPLISTLRPGVLVIYRAGAELRVVVNGGFAEVSPTGLTVLADFAVPVEEFDSAWLVAEIEDTEDEITQVEEGPGRDKIVHHLEHLRTLRVMLAP